MPNQTPLQRALKSERVVQLLAACIRTAVRLRYARELPHVDSIELARKHELQSALKTISEKLELHRNLPDGHGFGLAVAETKLVESNLGTEKIVAIREAAATALESSQSSFSEFRLVIGALRAAEEDTRIWAKAYSRFLSELETLYRSTGEEINKLDLPVIKQLEAQAELEKIIVDTVRRAGVA